MPGQAVHDILSRAVSTLERWEAKLKLYEALEKKKDRNTDILANSELTPMILKEYVIIRRVLLDS